MVNYTLTMRSLLALLLALSTAAAAYDPIVLTRDWYRVTKFANTACTGEVGTNGRFYVLTVDGLEPGEPAYLTIANGDMRRIERAVKADGEGRWRDYYIPFRFNRDGGNVSVTLASETCTVPFDFAWTRAKGWDEPAPLQPR